MSPTGAAGAPPPAVELRGIEKRFAGVAANDGVDLVVEAGTVHAVVGENGAGKSTLMKVLYGMLQPDEGTVSVGGKGVRFRSPKDAIAAGVGMVHQHFMLADNLTVLENVVLGAEPTRRGRLDRAEARRRIAELGRSFGASVPPDRLVEDLAVGDRQRVEILKVLYRGARVVILDEPTAVLVPQEVGELFANLAELRRQGVTALFISHKLDEVLAVADRITVLRAGRTVGTVAAGEVTAHRLAEMMVGAELPRPEKRGSTVTDEVALAIDGLRVEAPGAGGDGGGRALVDDATFSVRRGEVVGVAGVEGNGQTELVEAVLGLRPVAAGTVRLGSEDVTAWPTRRRRRAGLGYVPEDRHRNGLLLPAPLWENGMLGHQGARPFARGPWVDRRAARRRTAEVVAGYGVRTPGVDVAVQSLSGGNQQKLIVGREMTAAPRVLVASHPTRGVDVGAQAAVWEEQRRARAEGLAVLLVSADLDELIGLSDTLLVMLRGRIVARLDPKDATPEALGAHMTGAAGPAATDPVAAAPSAR